MQKKKWKVVLAACVFGVLVGCGNNTERTTATEITENEVEENPIEETPVESENEEKTGDVLNEFSDEEIRKAKEFWGTDVYAVQFGKEEFGKEDKPIFTALVPGNWAWAYGGEIVEASKFSQVATVSFASEDYSEHIQLVYPSDVLGFEENIVLEQNDLLFCSYQDESSANVAALYEDCALWIHIDSSSEHYTDIDTMVDVIADSVHLAKDTISGVEETEGETAENIEKAPAAEFTEEAKERASKFWGTEVCEIKFGTNDGAVLKMLAPVDFSWTDTDVMNDHTTEELAGMIPGGKFGHSETYNEIIMFNETKAESERNQIKFRSGHGSKKTDGASVNEINVDAIYNGFYVSVAIDETSNCYTDEQTLLEIISSSILPAN